ncbi:NmrA family NAD(P)-binding protein [Deinococcus alpinitundrae]|uniref:NmrA family NAD(P)-binding protein n=1 Tax=Deinococcus alpinitundrae TaxID=468913 RepID=UPI00137A2FC1|nr:NmrA family NAD(P)-binding protein [Deinococcus alpinitundrae]
MKTILITGATGNVGSEVVKALKGKRVNVVAAVTELEKPELHLPADTERVRFVFGEEATYAPAFQGVDAVFLLRPPQISDAKHLINPAIDAMRAAGVRAVTFLSVQGAQSNPLVPHHAIEKHLEHSGLEYTFLRAAFFMQNLSTTHRDDIRLHDDIMIPAGNGRTAFVDVRDLAAVAALTLTGEGHVRQAYELTSAEALTYSEVAQILSEVLRRTIRYPHPNVVQFWERMHERHQAVGYVLVMTALYAVAALGKAGHLTHDTKRLLGRDPLTFRQFAQDFASVWEKAPA